MDFGAAGDDGLNNPVHVLRLCAWWGGVLDGQMPCGEARVAGVDMCTYMHKNTACRMHMGLFLSLSSNLKAGILKRTNHA